MCNYVSYESKKGEIFETANGNLVFVCGICNSANIGLKEVENHLKTHISSIIIKEETNIDIAPGIYISKDVKFNSNMLYKNISDNLELSNKKNPYPHLNVNCEYCPKRFPCSGLRNLHIAVLHNGRMSPYNCYICNAYFSIENLYVKHMQSHKLSASINCPLCGHIFETMKKLMDHINGKEIFHSSSILREQSTNTVYSTHPKLPLPLSSIKTLHPIIGNVFNQYKCDICDKIYSSRRQIQSHLYSHLNKKPFKCNICDWSFAQSCNLKSHLNRHAGKKPHKCSYCDKTFTTRTEVNTHTRTHTGEKGHICSYCGNQFPTSGRLTIHIRRSHTKERTYKCPNIGCNISYYTRRDLVVHIRNHTGERPIVCELCDTTFASQKVYRVHLKLPEKLYNCKFCSCKFAQSSARRGHEKRVHHAT